MSKKKRTTFPWSGLGYGPVGFRKNDYIWWPCNYYLLRDRRRIDERFRMHAYWVSSSTQGQETVKTLQRKASWSRVGLGLKWQVQNISTLPKWKRLRIFRGSTIGVLKSRFLAFFSSESRHPALFYAWIPIPPHFFFTRFFARLLK